MDFHVVESDVLLGERNTEKHIFRVTIFIKTLVVEQSLSSCCCSQMLNAILLIDNLN